MSGSTEETIVGNAKAGVAAARTPDPAATQRLAELAAHLLSAAEGHIVLLDRTTEGPVLPQPLVELAMASSEPVALTDTGALSSERGGGGAFLGTRLIGSDGRVLGVLAVTQRGRRAWTAADADLLRRLAQPVVAEVELASLSARYDASRLVWQLAVDSAGIGAFDCDLLTGRLRWDERFLELLSLRTDASEGTLEGFGELVHPEDRARVASAMAAAVDTGSAYVAEFRVLRRDGSVRWLSARGQTIRDSEGRAVRLVGAAFDSTGTQDEEARVSRTLESMPIAFFSVDPEWRFTYVNAEAERLLGASREDLTGTVLWDAFPAARGSDFEVHYRRAAESGAPVAFDAHYPAPLDAWYDVRAWPTETGLSVYFVDSTARHRAEIAVREATRRSGLLAHVTAELSGTLDAEEGVGRLAPLVVPHFADWCVVTLLADDPRPDWRQNLRDVGWWHADERLRGAVQRYAGLRLASLGDDSFLVRAMRTGLPVLVQSRATAQIQARLAAGEARDLCSLLAPEAMLVVPLPGRDGTVGFLSVYRGAERGAFGDADMAILEDVARRAGLALDNARLFSRQADLAEGLQRSMLTTALDHPRLAVAVRYEPASEAVRVGGDWYDAFGQADGAAMVLVGDVVGRGAEAAAVMGQLRNAVRAVAVHTGAGPAETLRGVDQVLERLALDATATAIVVRVEPTGDGAVATWSSAAHPWALVVEPGGPATFLPVAGGDPVVGAAAGSVRQESRRRLPTGAVLLLLTDGLVEAAGAEELPLVLAALVEEGLGLEELCDELLAQLLVEAPADDVALLALRVLGAT